MHSAFIISFALPPLASKDLFGAMSLQSETVYELFATRERNLTLREHFVVYPFQKHFLRKTFNHHHRVLEEGECMHWYKELESQRFRISTSLRFEIDLPKDFATTTTILPHEFATVEIYPDAIMSSVGKREVMNSFRGIQVQRFELVKDSFADGASARVDESAIFVV